MFKPVDGSGGHGIVIGPHASDEELAAVGEQVLADPRGWIAQELVMLSTVPSKDGDRLRPATSTCARSPPTTASGSTCCPAG